MKSTAAIRIADAPGNIHRSGGDPLEVPALASLRLKASLTGQTRHRPHKLWLDRITRPSTCLVVVAISAVLLAYSAAVGARMPRVSAGVVEDTSSSSLMGEPAVSQAEIEELQCEAVVARERLVLDRSDFRSQLANLESKARALGWLVELNLEPSIAAPDGQAQLIAYRAVMHLSPEGSRTSLGYSALLDWLEGVTWLPKHAEVTSLRLGATGPDGGLSKARVELQMLGENPDRDEETNSN